MFSVNQYIIILKKKSHLRIVHTKRLRYFDGQVGYATHSAHQSDCQNDQRCRR